MGSARLHSSCVALLSSRSPSFGEIAARPSKQRMVIAENIRFGQVRRSRMETQTEDKLYSHYNHTDACKFSRWNARECYEFMYERPWEQVHAFYKSVVNGHVSLSGLFGTERTLSDTLIHGDAEICEASDRSPSDCHRDEGRTGRWARVTFKIVLSYHGASFDGWQKQPDLNTVQGLVERSLGKFVDDRKVELLKDKGLPIEGPAIVAGRTDKGVTALEQVCSFYTWRKDVNSKDIEDSINAAAPGMVKVKSVDQVSRKFHPNFSAKWRRYMYIFPLKDEDLEVQSSGIEENLENRKPVEDHDNQKSACADHFHEGNSGNFLENYGDDPESQKKPTKFRVSKVNQLLRQLEGKLLSYKMFARDTKPSRNIGPPTECFLYHARATEVILPCSAKDEKGVKAMCVELVGNRFLRKMVRVLVATTIREAAAGAEEDALLNLMDATCRRATAPPAPPDGLCLVDVGYTNFEPKLCLISS